MKIFRALAEFEPRNRPVCLALGFFDGVHLGHQAVIRQALEDAACVQGQPVVLTFDQHPSRVVAPHRVPPMLQTLDQRLACFEALGMQATVLVHFDEAFSRLPAETFVRQLASAFGRLHSISVGSSFTFGHERSGNVATLEALGRELNFTVHGVPAFLLDGLVVSSTRIREAIRRGHLEAAARMLGRDWALAGPVVPGDGLGRKLGVPTANVDYDDLVLPPNGVYAGWARLSGQTHRAVLNIGHRPTVARSEARPLRVEAHLLDFQGDLYGRTLEFVPKHKLRDEQTFPSVEALREQIQRDIQSARERLSDAAH